MKTLAYLDKQIADAETYLKQSQDRMTASAGNARNYMAAKNSVAYWRSQITALTLEKSRSYPKEKK